MYIYRNEYQVKAMQTAIKLKQLIPNNPNYQNIFQSFAKSKFTQIIADKLFPNLPLLITIS
jgi:hypothetical protein